MAVSKKQRLSLEDAGEAVLSRAIATLESGESIRAADLQHLAKLFRVEADRRRMHSDSPLVTAKLFAEWAGVSVHSISRWKRDGFPKSGKGGLSVIDGVRWLADRYQDFCKLKARFDRLSNTADAKKNADARLRELDLAEREGQLIDITDVRRDVRAIVVAHRNTIGSLARSMMHSLAHKTPQEIYEILNRETSRQQTALADSLGRVAKRK